MTNLIDSAFKIIILSAFQSDRKHLGGRLLRTKRIKLTIKKNGRTLEKSIKNVTSHQHIIVLLNPVSDVNIIAGIMTIKRQVLRPPMKYFSGK